MQVCRGLSLGIARYQLWSCELFPSLHRGSTQNKADARKKKRISEADRLFSNSSVTSQKVHVNFINVWCDEQCRCCCLYPVLPVYTCVCVFLLQAVNPRMVNENESSAQDVPSELSIHGSVPEDMSDSMSQTSSLAGEDRPGTSSLAFGGGSAYKRKRGPLAKFV